MASSAILIRASILLILLLALSTFAEPRGSVLESQISTIAEGVGSSLPKTDIGNKILHSSTCTKKTEYTQLYIYPKVKSVITVEFAGGEIYTGNCGVQTCEIFTGILPEFIKFRT
ncbi:uncharacterized protein LOC110104606 [Dendrobium catenatum]|uniref:uncharacterized protein LOC110104606 n=1 Tax=Dendrobium catenatum TaxID=906689 RepID=UPI00109F7CBE|nr:uncharacterized protein LOC110104606 [Dendrobium catenatum]